MYSVDDITTNLEVMGYDEICNLRKLDIDMAESFVRGHIKGCYIEQDVLDMTTMYIAILYEYAPEDNIDPKQMTLNVMHQKGLYYYG